MPSRGVLTAAERAHHHGLSAREIDTCIRAAAATGNAPAASAEAHVRLLGVGWRRQCQLLQLAFRISKSGDDGLMAVKESTKALRQAMREQWELDPDATCREVYDAVTAMGHEVGYPSFQSYHAPAVRRELGLRGRPPGRRVPDAVAKEAGPPPAPPPPQPAENGNRAPRPQPKAAPAAPAAPARDEPAREPAAETSAPMEELPGPLVPREERVSLDVHQLPDGRFSVRATGGLRWIQRMIAALSEEAA